MLVLKSTVDKMANDYERRIKELTNAMENLLLSTKPISPEDSLILQRENLAFKLGAQHAAPFLRSMYPTRSRSAMYEIFTKLIREAWDSCYNEMNVRCQAAIQIHKDQVEAARAERDDYKNRYYDTIGRG